MKGISKCGPFRNGWDAGYQARATGGASDLSDREIADRNPRLSAEERAVWRNGYADGYKDDRFRLDGARTISS